MLKPSGTIAEKISAAWKSYYEREQADRQVMIARAVELGADIGECVVCSRQFIKHRGRKTCRKECDAVVQ